MTVFVDTSAFFSLLSDEDANHARSLETWAALHARQDPIETSNYVLLETMALAQRRLGMKAVHACHSVFFPLVEVVWVEVALHYRATAALLTASTRDLSLVDCVSFEMMRDRNLDIAFAFDQHFIRQGFTCIPAEPETQ
ncbi:MAG: type II toxin-antitoxin system VapC family toxin [Chloroflexota bacterium]